MHAPPTLPSAQGTSDAVLDRMLQAFGTSPLLSGAGAARMSMDSDQISLESVSEPTSEEDEWFAEVRSAKNPEPYVIQRPFDFAAFHRSLESVKGPYALASTMPPTVHQSQPSLAPVARRKSARKRVPAMPVLSSTDSNPSDKGEPTSLLRRLGRKARPARQQVKLRHFGSRVFGVWHAVPDPISPIGSPDADFRGQDEKLPEPVQGVSLATEQSAAQGMPLARPDTPLCTKIARSASVRSAPPRRKPVPRVQTHARAKSADDAPAPALPAKSSLRGDAQGSATPPPRPPKSVLRSAMGLPFPRGVEARAAPPLDYLTPCPSAMLHSSAACSAAAPRSVASSEAHDADLPALDSDYSDTESARSEDDLASIGMLVMRPALPPPAPAKPKSLNHALPPRPLVPT